MSAGFCPVVTALPRPCTMLLSAMATQRSAASKNRQVKSRVRRIIFLLESHEPRRFKIRRWSSRALVCSGLLQQSVEGKLRVLHVDGDEFRFERRRIAAGLLLARLEIKAAREVTDQDREDL